MSASKKKQEKQNLRDTFKQEFLELRNQDEFHKVFRKQSLEMQVSPNAVTIKVNFTKYYKEIKVLGQGSQGLVKKIQRRSDDQLFAAKIIYSRDEEQIHNITKEFQTVQKLNHPNIIKYHELYIDKQKSKIYIVMEYLKAQTLDQLSQSKIQMIQRIKNLQKSQNNSKIKQNNRKFYTQSDLNVNQNNNIKFQDKIASNQQINLQNNDENESFTKLKNSVYKKDIIIQNKIGSYCLDDTDKTKYNTLDTINQQIKSTHSIQKSFATNKFQRQLIKLLSYNNEDIGKQIFFAVFSALKYLHYLGICHRDIKPQNILISKDVKSVKLIDFNASKQSQQNDKSSIEMWTINGILFILIQIQKFQGTIAYNAPEIYGDTSYNEKVDIWSAGLCLYHYLYGTDAFQSDYQADLIHLIQQGSYKFENNYFVSQKAKNFIQKCLQLNPKDRPTSKIALKDPWFQGQKNMIYFSYAEISSQDSLRNELQSIIQQKKTDNISNQQIHPLNLEKQNDHSQQEIQEFLVYHKDLIYKFIKNNFLKHIYKILNYD